MAVCLFRKGDRKGKFRTLTGGTNRNITAMQIDNGFDDIQTQSGTGTIPAAAAVYFIEPVKYMGQILCRNLGTCIDDEE